MKRLLLVHTGGTLMMQHAEQGGLRPDVYARDLTAELPVLRQIASIEAHVLCNVDSSDMQPESWVELARLVHEKRKLYDGIVIVHGTDTMAYTASALAFLVPGLDRPVVFTGAQKPLSAIRTDARTNLVDACHVATMEVPEVGIVFNSRLYRGCRATKLDAWSMAAFGSPSCAPLAELGLGVQLGSHLLPKRPEVAFDDRLEPRVLCVRTFPGLEPQILFGALETGVRGMVFEGFGAGNLPHLERSLIPVLQRANETDVPTVIVSQCPRGAVDLTAYEGGLAAARAGAIGGADMTSEAALTKLMIALGRVDHGESKISAARDAFAASWAGETG